MTNPIITFRVTVPTQASRDEIYTVLSDPNTHLVWAGEQAPMKSFRLLTMDADSGAAGVGTQFSSSGANDAKGKSTFRDQSVVVNAEPGETFGFNTDSHLTRVHAKEWHCRFQHRYTIGEADGRRTITYRCEVWPQNYKPYWVRPWFRPMTRAIVQRAHRKHMDNLVRLAESARDRRS